MRLRVFSDRAYLPDGAPHTVMLYPFWGQNPEDPADPNAGRFDHYEETGREFLDLTSLHDADLALLPFDWSFVEANPRALPLVDQFVSLAREAGKTTAIFFSSDSAEPLPYDDVLVFRTSAYRSKRRVAEFTHPAWSEDFVERYLGRLPLRERRSKPVVGFCGFPRVARPWLVRLRGRGSFDSPVRTLALRALAREDAVETNFVIRKHFLGGSLARGELDAGVMQRVRREYVQNMVDCDYVLCARGAGNFSYRLYETLSCGRIPVFIDTDCVLPYDFLVDWRDFCVWVDEQDVNLTGQRVAEFHERLSDSEFVELQHEGRGLWERYLRPAGFFANFHRHLSELPARTGLTQEASA